MTPPASPFGRAQRCGDIEDIDAVHHPPGERCVHRQSTCSAGVRMFRFDSQHDLQLLRTIGDDCVDAQLT